MLVVEDYNKPCQVGKQNENRGWKKSIFLKAFTLIPFLLPFLYPCMCIKMYTKDGTFLVASSHFKLSHVTHLYTYVFNVLFHPLNFHHHHHHHPLRSFHVLRSETNENAIFSLWNFCDCLRSVPENEIIFRESENAKIV